jgi:hypothetical protein
MKPVAKLENWAVVDSVASQSFQELQPGKHLTGYVSGHTNFQNAKFIYTSVIIEVDLNDGVVETRNTTYQLGRPSDEYRSWYQQRRAPAA